MGLVDMPLESLAPRHDEALQSDDPGDSPSPRRGGFKT